MPKVDGLTLKQELFVAEFLIDKNATQAAIRAGYSQKTAQRIGSENLSKPLIWEAIEAGIKKVMEAAGITAVMIREELGRLAFSDMSDYATFGPGGVSLKDSSEMDEDALRCVSEVSETITKDGGSIRFKLHDKRGALVDLGKDFGMFKDKIDVTHHGEIAITEVEIARPEEEE